MKSPDRIALIIGKLKDGMKSKADGLKDKYSGSPAESDKEPGPEGSKADDSEDKMEFESCADEILSAIESKDASALAEALHAFFELCESEPHDEGGAGAGATHVNIYPGKNKAGSSAQEE